MSDPWYERVDASVRLMQGDIIFDCPLLTWNEEAPLQVSGTGEAEVLKGAAYAVAADVVVMTQACDLEQNKVSSVVLCPHVSLTGFRSAWEAEMRARGQNPTQKAWRNTCEDIKDGYQWNLAIL